MFHFYLGDPVEMLLLPPKGEAQRVVLGPDLSRKQAVQFTVPHGVWQGARLVAGGKWALLGTTVAPGFDARDFELGRRDELVQQFPQAAELIRKLTR